MFPEEVKTERLRFERLCTDRIDPRSVHAFYSERNPSIEEEWEYFSRTPAKSLKETKEFIERAERQWEEDKAGVWAIFPRSGSSFDVDADEPVNFGSFAETSLTDFIGTTRLSIQWDRRSCYGFLWTRKPYWGNGIGSEMMNFRADVAFEILDLEILIVAHEKGNQRASSLIGSWMDKHGGRYEGLLRNYLTHDDHVADMERYTISKEEYQRSDPSADDV